MDRKTVFIRRPESIGRSKNPVHDAKNLYRTSWSMDHRLNFDDGYLSEFLGRVVSLLSENQYKVTAIRYAEEAVVHRVIPHKKFDMLYESPKKVQDEGWGFKNYSSCCNYASETLKAAKKACKKYEVISAFTTYHGIEIYCETGVDNRKYHPEDENEALESYLPKIGVLRYEIIIRAEDIRIQDREGTERVIKNGMRFRGA